MREHEAGEQLATTFQTFLNSDRYYTPEEAESVCIDLLDNVPLTTVKGVEYYEAPASFDIETTSFYTDDMKKAATMYVWTIGLFGQVILGRTWGEFVNTINTISARLETGEHRRLIVYIHNADFDFQFCRKWLTWYKVFSVQERKPLYMITDNGIEFRCSYKLSGYSLAYVGEHLQKYHVEKLTGDLDYTLLRHSETPLTEKELGYIINDSKVVMAYVQECIETEGTITAIPLTKTGYVRRYVREKCFGDSKESRGNYHWFITRMKLKPLEYAMLKRAFQGGYTHASPFFVDKIVENVDNYDFTSSYPAQICAHKYPMTSGTWRLVKNEKQFRYYLKEYCCLFDIELENVYSTFVFDNYISSSRCTELEGEVLSNGRVVSAARLVTTITEQDFAIIESTYKWKVKRIGKFRTYGKGYLPKEFIDAVLELYERKTQLKGVVGMEREYMFAKELLNSCYGMCVTDIAKSLIPYTDNEWITEKSKEKQEEYKKLDETSELLDKYNTNWNRFNFYPWGVWITAYARRAVWTGIQACGPDYVYSDTDSIKIRNPERHSEYINKYNEWITEKLETMCKTLDIPIERTRPKTKDGVEKPLGVWDFDGNYKRIKTLGAKRYLVEYSEDPRNGKDRGKIVMTVSGLDKKSAVTYLEKRYGKDRIFEAFNAQMDIPGGATGKQTHSYIDKGFTLTLTDYTGLTATVTERSCIHLEPAPYSAKLAKQFINYYKYIQGLAFEL